ncbi:MAG: hypothetical protein ACPGYX_09925, partial [Oceanobacter sp.]
MQEQSQPMSPNPEYFELVETDVNPPSGACSPKVSIHILRTEFPSGYLLFLSATENEVVSHSALINPSLIKCDPVSRCIASQ